MSGCVWNVRPVGVALRGQEGSVVLFACELPASIQGKVKAWATCGQRKRFPVPADIRSDVRGSARKVMVAVRIPELYSACTLHVVVVDGGRPRFASCRVDDALFWSLAKTIGNAENDPGYHEWFMAHRADDAELSRQRRESTEFALRPLVSIVTPVYRTPAPFLKELIDSMLAQTYGNFELVLVNVSGEWPEVDDVLSSFDDERIRVIEAPNRSIPENTNAGIAAARGDYIGFVDHDDFIEPDALFRYVEAINECPECDLLFCDEDLWDGDLQGGRFCGPRFKPGWDPVLLHSYNYVCHLLMVSRWALDRIELSSADVNGAQDYDLTFKAAEVARAIRAVPGILYHWRKHEESTASNRDSKPYAVGAGERSVRAHFARVGLEADVVEGTTPFSYRVLFGPARPEDVTMILVAAQVGASKEGVVSALGGEIELLTCGHEALNEAVDMASGSRIVVIDSSVDVSGQEWLDVVLRQLSCPQVGCVSPLLIDDELVVRSAGLVLGADGVWRNLFDGYLRDDVGYMAMLEHEHSVLAAPFRCLAFRKADFERVGGFDADLSGDARAVDFCLKLRGEGLTTALVPQVAVEVRGGLAPIDDAALARAVHDPYLNPLLSQIAGDFILG